MPKCENKTLGELIREALAEKGWNNAELARRTDFSPTYIGNLVNDKTKRLPDATVDKLADALQRPRAEFRKAAGLAFEEAEIPEIEFAVQIEKVLSIINALPASQRPQFLNTINLIYGKEKEAMNASTTHHQNNTSEQNKDRTSKKPVEIEPVTIEPEAERVSTPQSPLPQLAERVKQTANAKVIQRGSLAEG